MRRTASVHRKQNSKRGHLPVNAQKRTQINDSYAIFDSYRDVTTHRTTKGPALRPPPLLRNHDVGFLEPHRVDHLVHGARRLCAAGLAHDPGGNARDRHIVRNRFHHHGPGRNPRTMADLDIAEDLCAGADHHAMADLRMTILVLLAGPAERDAMENGDVVLDDRGLAADKAGSVVEEDAAADPGGRIDVGLEHRGGAALQVVGEILAALQVEPVRKAMRLQRMKALEVEKRIDEARGRGIAVVDCNEIGSEHVAKIWNLAQRLVIGLADQVARQRRMVEAVGQTMHHRVFQAIVMEHGGVDEGRKLRFAMHDVFGLGADAIPDRIERRQLSSLRIDLMYRHAAAPENFFLLIPYHDGATKS